MLRGNEEKMNYTARPEGFIGELGFEHSFKDQQSEWILVGMDTRERLSP